VIGSGIGSWGGDARIGAAKKDLAAMRGASNAALKVSGNDCEVSHRISRYALQNRSRIRHRESDDGVRRLMWAVLKDTLRCYQCYAGASTPRGQRLFRDADRWVRSSDITWLFSFETVCSVLGIDSDYLRNELWRWRHTRRHALRSGGAK